MTKAETTRAVLGVLAEAERRLSVTEVARLAELPRRRVGDILMGLWREGLTTRVWGNGRDDRCRCYPITDAGREQWAEVCAS